MLRDLTDLVSTHRTYAEWERVKRTASTIVALQFPDRHPLQQRIEDLRLGLEDFRYRSEVSVVEFEQKYGRIEVLVDGIYYKDATMLFRSHPNYMDCPDFSIGGWVPRRKELDLHEVAVFHHLELSARRFIKNVEGLPGSKPPHMKKYLKRAASRFEKSCLKMDRHVKRARVSATQKYLVLLCLRSVGMGNDITKHVLDFLV